jgi:hypothetical protein
MVVERGYNLLKSVEGGLLVMCLRGIGKRSSEDDEFGKNRELGMGKQSGVRKMTILSGQYIFEIFTMIHSPPPACLRLRSSCS